MHTEWHIAGEVVWRERCEFLARAGRAAPAGDARRAALTASDVGANAAESALEEGPVISTSFRAEAGLGRRYGQVSGDLNPIHVADLTARLFGFRAAIAHGMWSLARCAAELGAAVPASTPRQLEVQFRRPVFLPSWLSLRSARDATGVRFVLLDSQGEKLHLVGSLRRAA
jgi:acyl dehydratase